MARHGRSGRYESYDYDDYELGGRRRGSSAGGCLGCLTVLALCTGVAFAIVLNLAPPAVRNVAEAMRRHALKVAGVYDGGEAMDQSGLGYSGSRLSEAEQGVYLQLLAGIESLEPTFPVFDATAEDIDPAYKALMRDHPELFWVDGSCVYTYSTVGSVVTVEPTYTTPAEEVAGLRATVEAEADAVLAGIPEDADAYEVARAAYEYVVGRTDYALGSDQNQNILSVFVNHRSVCAGYARAYQYLLHRAGQFCAYVDGTVDGGNEEHAWCLVQLDGEYAFVDPTWGDPTYLGEQSQLPANGVIYDYLCVTTDEIERDGHAFADPDAWPLCASTNLDYYRRCGLFFDEYDEAALTEAFWAQADNGFAAFKFGSDESLAMARDSLANGEFQREELLAIADTLAQNGIRYSYTISEPLRIVKLYW